MHFLKQKKFNNLKTKTHEYNVIIISKENSGKNTSHPLHFKIL